MDTTVISDTHGLHGEINLRAGTILIHAGDITEYGTEAETIDFLDWFQKQPFKYRLLIAGNHDLYLEECTIAKRNRLIPRNVIYLQNSSITIDGLNIYGSPITPYYLGMAFNAKEKDIKEYWNKIPIDTDILITHGPPKDILENGFGCNHLLNQVKKTQPTIHCFGHVHGQNGIEIKYGTTFINAAMVNILDAIKDEGYKIIARPIKIDVP